MHICQVVPILRVRCEAGSGKDDAGAVDKDIKTTKLFSNRHSNVYQVLIGREFSLNRQSLRRVLNRDTVKLIDVSADHSDSSSIIQIPEGQ